MWFFVYFLIPFTVIKCYNTINTFIIWGRETITYSGGVYDIIEVFVGIFNFWICDAFPLLIWTTEYPSIEMRTFAVSGFGTAEFAVTGQRIHGDVQFPIRIQNWNVINYIAFLELRQSVKSKIPPLDSLAFSLFHDLRARLDFWIAIS